MPDNGRKPVGNRTFILKDSRTWEDAMRVASVRGETVSEAIGKFLKEYIQQNRSLLNMVDRAKAKG